MTTADGAVRISQRLTYSVLFTGRNNHIPFFATFFFLHPIYHPRTILALPPSSNSDPGSRIGPSSSLPTSARAFIFTARRIEHFLPSSTRVELYLAGALSS